MFFVGIYIFLGVADREVDGWMMVVSSRCLPFVSVGEGSVFAGF